MQHYSVKPLALALRPSRWLAGVMITVGVSCSLITLLLPISIALKLPMLAAIVGAVGHAVWRHALRRGAAAIAGLEVNAKGDLFCYAGLAGWQPAQVLDTSYVTPWLTVLNLRVEGKRLPRHVVLLPDACDAEALRRLRVWLKWGRQIPENGTTSDHYS